MRTSRKPTYFFTGPLWQGDPILVYEPRIARGRKFLPELVRLRETWIARVLPLYKPLKLAKSHIQNELEHWPTDRVQVLLRMLERKRRIKIDKLLEMIPEFIDACHVKQCCHVLLKAEDDRVTCGIGTSQYFGISWTTATLGRKIRTLARNHGLRIPPDDFGSRMCIGRPAWRANIQLGNTRRTKLTEDVTMAP